MRKSALVAAIAASALIGGGIVLAKDDGSDAAASPPKAAKASEPAQQRRVRVLVRTFKTGSLARTLRLRGVTAPAREVEIKAQTAGLIITPPLRKGARVAAGQVLCKIEPADRAAQLEQAKAKLAQAKIDAAGAEKLSRRGYASEAKLAADRAALAAARAAVAAIELDLQRMTIKAPFAGILETDTAETGALMQSGSICAKLIVIDPIHFVGYATESEVSGVKLGQSARARLLDGREIDAKVTFIARSADAATRTFRIEAVAANPEALKGGQLRGGLTTEITLSVAAATGHRLPASALTLDPAGRIGVRVVATTDAGAVARFKPVTLLGDRAENIWVTGLADTETVIVRGQEYVSDGAPITPMTEAEAAAAQAAARK
ncbi:MAG: efflux RND transporter periplasmic adaptor subunit [Neomegalonema sp.]|nr:efflux RND transporter periplasmic adaptor subunit [Neomegalonema sp.]